MKQGWEIKKLGDVASFKRGLTYSKKDEVEYSKNCILRSNNIELETMSILFDELKYIREDFVINDDKKVKSNTILICMSNGSKQHIGKVAFIDKEYDYAFGGFMGLIKPNPDIFPKFLFYSCISSSYKQFLAGVGNGANITNIKFSDLSEFKIPIPPLAEQERIVAELDCLSGVIEKKKQQLKELDALAQSIFYEMFGDPITNEKGWEVKKLGEISIKISNGYNAKLEENTYKQYGIPYFRCQNIWWNRIDYNDIVYIDEKTNEIMKSSTLMKYDLIISKIGRVYTENSSLFRTAIYEGEDRKANISGNLCYVRLNKSIIPKFILGILTQEKYRNWAKINTPGGIDKRAMSITQISNLPIILPPLSLQQSFASKIEAIEKQKELIKQSIKEVETLFNSRMDYYFN